MKNRTEWIIVLRETSRSLMIGWHSTNNALRGPSTTSEEEAVQIYGWADDVDSSCFCNISLVTTRQQSNSHRVLGSIACFVRLETENFESDHSEDDCESRSRAAITWNHRIPMQLLSQRCQDSAPSSEWLFATEIIFWTLQGFVCSISWKSIAEEGEGRPYFEQL